MLTTLILLLITLISKVTGFLRELVIASSFGVSSQADSFYIVTIIPLLIFAVIGTALKDSMIPSLSKMKPQKSSEVFQSFIFIIFVVSILIASVFTVFSEHVLYLIDPKEIVGKKEYETGVWLIVFVLINNIVTGKLLSEQKFVPASLYGLVSNGSVIVYYLTVRDISVLGLLFSLAIGLLFHTLLQLFFMTKSKINISFKASKEMKIIFINAMPILIGSAVLELSVLVDRIIASYIGTGSVSAISYAHRLSFFIINILAMVIITPFYSKMSKINIINQENKMILLQKSILIILSITLPLTLLGLIYSESIIQVVFGRGEFDLNAVKLTESAFIFYLLASPFYSLRDIITKFYYTESRFKVTLLNGIYTLLINVILSLWLGYMYGIKGIGMATFISILITTLILQLKLKNKQINRMFVFTSLISILVFILIL